MMVRVLITVRVGVQNRVGSLKFERKFNYEKLTESLVKKQLMLKSYHEISQNR